MTKPKNLRRLYREAKGVKSYSEHYVCVVPAALAATINQTLERHGHGPNNLSVPLYDNVTNELTHYGCSVSLTSPAYTMLRNMFPPEAEAFKGQPFDDVIASKNLHKKDPEV